MIEVLGGIADWLHENGVKTSFDIAYEESRRKTSLPNFDRESLKLPVLGIYSAGDEPASFCWIDGSRLLMQEVSAAFLPGHLETYFYGGGRWNHIQSAFELADPGFLDNLLSAAQLYHKGLAWPRDLRLL